ncbi:hypothetical protein LguiB_021789 [Lonicera macranthoides]
MWFFGLSTKNSRNFWVIGAIFLVIIFTVILRKWVVYLVNRNEELDREIGGKSGEERQDGKAVVIRTYALEELKKATRNFKIRIGVGATSYVYLADLGDGKMGAVKRVMEKKGGSRKMFLDEISILLRISHPNLVGLMGFCLDKGEQLLLLEYVPNKSLFDRMHTQQGQSKGPLPWSNRLSIALDVARGLEYLHVVADPPVIHRDVKSSNILLTYDNRAKLADFGLCKLGHDTIMAAQTPTTIKGSLGILSPKSDVYSFGVLILELVTGLKSLQGSTTLAEWTEDCRMNYQSVEDLVGLLDPKLQIATVNLQQLRALIDVANLALHEDSEARPDMIEIVYSISNCIQIQTQVKTELPV